MIYETYDVKELQDLIGAQIEKISIGTRKRYLKFETNKGTIGFATWGDCCSFTEFVGIENINALLRNTVIDIKQIPYKEIPQKYLGANPEDSDGGVAAHAVEFITNSGKAQLYFSNFSNGYYDGGLGKIDKDIDALTDRVWNKSTNKYEDLPIVWQDITGDWFAEYVK